MCKKYRKRVKNTRKGVKNTKKCKKYKKQCKKYKKRWKNTKKVKKIQKKVWKIQNRFSVYSRINNFCMQGFGGKSSQVNQFVNQSLGMKVLKSSSKSFIVIYSIFQNYKWILWCHVLFIGIVLPIIFQHSLIVFCCYFSVLFTILKFGSGNRSAGRYNISSLKKV